MNRIKNPKPNKPNTIDGTPARLLIDVRIILVNKESLAYSLRYIAEQTPSGTVIIIIISVTAIVPKIAGKIPPSVILFLGSSKINSTEILPIPCITIFPIRSSNAATRKKNIILIIQIAVNPAISVFFYEVLTFYSH